MSHLIKSRSKTSSTLRCAAGNVGRVLEGEKTSPRATGGECALLHQEAVGQHDQGWVPVEDAVQPLQAVPAPALAASPHLRKVAQAKLTFGVLVELLDDPPTVRQGHKAFNRSISGQIGVVPLDIAVVAWEGTLRKEPSLGSCGKARMTASTCGSAAPAAWAGFPVARWARIATDCLQRVFLVPSRQATVCHASCGAA
ncbi:MAG TPA: hypothetical protein VMX14_10220 [Anaerolineae bacterium]|nr:hypothetical protein [Anaerolineae bacterium]